jgi:uncharacterized protein YdhG (YjbR/CyaY superfamily)
METTKKKFGTIDEYIAAQPESNQAILSKIRETIQAAVPDLQETIKYDMPTFTSKGFATFVISFSAFKHHIGMYPLTDEIRKKLGKKVLPYQGTKDSLRLAWNEPIPYDLIGKIVKVRAKEDLAYNKKKEQKAKAEAKAKAAAKAAKAKATAKAATKKK